MTNVAHEPFSESRAVFYFYMLDQRTRQLEGFFTLATSKYFIFSASLQMVFQGTFIPEFEVTPRACFPPV